MSRFPTEGVSMPNETGELEALDAAVTGVSAPRPGISTRSPPTSAVQLATNPPLTLPFDRTLVEVMPAAKHLEQIQIVNGLVPENVLQALRGEHVGTTIHCA